MTDIILRVERNEKYKTVNLAACEDDTRLSWKAIGVLWYLLSRARDWKLNRTDLVNRHTDGEGAVKSALVELRDAGYLRIDKLKGDGGRFVSHRWVVSERPLTKAEWAVIPQEPAPPLDNPQRLENHPLENDPLNKKKLSSTRVGEGGVPQEASPPPAPDEEQELVRDSPEVAAFVTEVRRLCQRLRVPTWPLRTQTMREWCREVAADVRYAGLSLAHEAQHCGEWWEPRVKSGKPKAPHLTLRRWLDRAVQIHEANGEAAKDPQDRFVENELERQLELCKGACR